MKGIGSVIVDAADINAKQPKMPIAFRRRRGASLVEMLIAIIVLAVVLISMVGMFVISRTAIFSNEDETAVTMALRYLEELEDRDFEDFSNSAMFPRDSHNENPNQRFRIITTVEQVNDYYAEVKVEVRWSGATRGVNSVELSRVISAVGFKNVGEMR